jgi:hypothetical protein
MSERFAQIVVVDDYHDIEYVASSFPAKKLHSREIGSTVVQGRFKYVGVIFEGGGPTYAKLKTLLEESKVVLKDEVTQGIDGSK